MSDKAKLMQQIADHGVLRYRAGCTSTTSSAKLRDAADSMYEQIQRSVDVICAPQAMTQGDLTHPKIRAIAICDAGAYQDDKTAEWTFSDAALMKFSCALLAAHPVQPAVLYKSGAKSPDGTYEAVPIAQPEPVVVSDALEEEIGKVLHRVMLMGAGAYKHFDLSVEAKRLAVLASAQPMDSGDVRDRALELAYHAAENVPAFKNGNTRNPVHVRNDILNAISALKSQQTEHPPSEGVQNQDDCWKQAVMEISDDGFGATYKKLISDLAAQIASVAQPVQKPVAWWNGLRKFDYEDGTQPSFSPVEDTRHDIPLYSGVNPCNNAAPLSLSQQADAEKP